MDRIVGAQGQVDRTAGGGRRVRGQCRLEGADSVGGGRSRGLTDGKALEEDAERLGEVDVDRRRGRPARRCPILGPAASMTRTDSSGANGPVPPPAYPISIRPARPNTTIPP